MVEWNRGQLRRVLGERMSLKELQTAAFDLNVDDYEGRLEGDLIIHLLTYLENRGRLAELIDWLTANRPDIDGRAFIKSPTTATTSSDNQVNMAASPPPEPRVDTSLDALAYYDKGVARMERGDWSGALADMTQAIALRHDYVDAYVQRGSVRLRRGDRDGGLADFNQALTLQPQHLEALLGRARVRLDLSDFEGAAADLSRVIAAKPGEAEAYAWRGQARRGQGDVAGALADVSQALDLRVDDPEVWRLRATLREQLGDIKGAIQDLEMTRRLEEPDEPITLFTLAGAYLEAGLTDKADAVAREALVAFPDDDLYHRAALMALVNMPGLAISRLEAAIQADPTWRAAARSDPHWRGLRDDPDFQHLVGQG